MPNSQIIAVIFDFDDTLVPDSTTGLLKKYGVDTDSFWSRDVKKLVSSGYDQSLAYLKLMMDKIGEGKDLGLLTRSDLIKFGASLDSTFYPGIPRLFADLKKIVDKYQDIQIEFYVISGGIQDIIEGSKIAKDNFQGIYASRLCGDSEGGVLRNIMRCITFTEKTRYVYEINKGFRPEQTLKNPNLVNQAVEQTERRIPFKNMIYIGDGLTDIPCFSLIDHFGGLTFGVFNPEDENSAKKVVRDFLQPHRVKSINAPKYGPKDDLGALLRTAVASRCTRIQLDRESAFAV